jgi:NADH-ubiquinone oxidoreductase chain 6
MFNLYVLKETFTNGFRLELLDILYIVSPFLGIFTIVSKNPIVSVLFLICLFLNISCYLMALGLNFLGLSYLLVYVGAVSILFLFILMLINVRVSELLSDTNKSIPLGILLVILFIVPVYGILPFDLSNQKNLLHYTINLFQDSQVKELIYIFFVTNGM